MNLYKQYVKEREDLETIERDGKGFLLYKISDDPHRHLYIADLYVTPDFRESRIATEMADEAVSQAKEKDVNIAYCQVDKEANNWELSKHVIECYGFKRYEEVGAILVFFKEI